MKKTKLLAILMTLALTFSCMGLTGCSVINDLVNSLFGTESSTPEPNPGDSSSTKPSSSVEEADNYTVTFRYGFAEGATYDEATKKPSEYAETLEKESKSGKKIALTSSDKNKFEVEGYTVAGYSTMDWNSNGITADLTVDVLYEREESFTVTFKNPDGSVIKTITDVEKGGSVSDNELPATQIPVYSITEAEYEALNTSLKGFYQPYGETNTYILSAEASKVATTVVIPRGTKFDGWTGSYANIEANTDIVAKTTKVTKEISSTATEARVEAKELTTKLTSTKSISATST